MLENDDNLEIDQEESGWDPCMGKSHDRMLDVRRYIVGLLEERRISNLPGEILHSHFFVSIRFPSIVFYSVILLANR